MTPEQITDLRRQKYNATVLRLLKVHSDLMVLRVRPDFPRPPHKPGQYGVLGLGFWEPRLPGCQEEMLNPGDETKLARRSYSHQLLRARRRAANCSTSRRRTGSSSTSCWCARPTKPTSAGPDAAAVHAARGRPALPRREDHRALTRSIRCDPTIPWFSWPPAPARRRTITCCGSLLRRGHRGRILSACCVRYGKDLAYRAIHDELMRRYPHYTYLPLDDARSVGRGRIKCTFRILSPAAELEERLGQPLDPAATHVFLCGNPKMIGVPEKDRETGERVYPTAAGRDRTPGAPRLPGRTSRSKFKGNIHYEEYW